MSITSYYHGKKIWLISKKDPVSEELISNLKGIAQSLSVSRHLEEPLDNKQIIQDDFLTLPVDFLQKKDFQRITEILLQKWQHIDLIIFCARSVEKMEFVNFDAERAKKMLDLNFLGFNNLLGAVIPLIINFQLSHLAVVASSLGYFGLPNSLVYGASHAALINLVESLGYNLPAYKVKLSLISTGFISAVEHGSVPMTFIIDPPDTAELILKGLITNKFEVHFPKRFTYIMKVMGLLPYKLQRFFINILEKTFK